MNGMSEKITVVNRDVAKLQRGKDIARQGVNVIVADIFDSGDVLRLRNSLPVMSAENLLSLAKSTTLAKTLILALSLQGYLVSHLNGF